MPRYFIAISILTLILSLSCSSDEPIEEVHVPIGEVTCETAITAADKYYQDNGDWYLWGGADSMSHFTITNFTLDPCKLRYGLGREHFQALITPTFSPLWTMVDQLQDHDRIIVLKEGGAVKLYPLSILRQYELVNDEINGKPVMVVYCFLAELAAVYDRTYCNLPFTFGVSGYTYSDLDIKDGLESFILWDRNTESLWWPINNQGVSGAFEGSNLRLYPSAFWEEKRWSEIKDLYPDAVVLNRGQLNDENVSNWPFQKCF